MFRDILDEVIVRTKQWYGSNKEVSQRYDSTNGQFVQRDEANGTDQVVINDGNDLADELEAGGALQLIVGNLLNFDPVEVGISTRANQPAAGTADRVYIITDAAGGPVIERDDGASWNVIGAATAALHQSGAAELSVENLATGTTNTDQFLAADGNGGVEFKAAGGAGAGKYIAEDANGNHRVEQQAYLYFGDAGNNELTRYDVSADSETVLGSFGSAGSDMAAPANGKLYQFDENDEVDIWDIAAGSATTSSTITLGTAAGACSQIS